MTHTQPAPKKPNTLLRVLDTTGTTVMVGVLLVILFLTYGIFPNRWYQVMVVSSGSMSPAFEAGDVIVITRPPEQLEEGMILTLMVNGSIVTHRLIGFAADGSMITQGDANPVPDSWEGDINVVGLYRFHIPRLGFLLQKPVQWLRGGTTGSWYVDIDHTSASEVGVLIPPTPTYTATATQEAEPPQTRNCTYGQGYWKNHPAAWLLDELWLGSRTYSKAEALDLLSTPVRGSHSLALAHQLIAARLNLAMGADPAALDLPALFSDAVTEADKLLVVFPPGSEVHKDYRQQVANLTQLLDDFNEGKIGPGHCDARPDPARQALPSQTPTLSPTPTLTATIEVQPLRAQPIFSPTPTYTSTPTDTQTPLPAQPTATNTVEPPTPTLPLPTLPPEPTDTPEPAPTHTTQPDDPPAPDPSAEPSPEDGG